MTERTDAPSGGAPDRRAKEIFLDALELPAVERASRIRSAADGDESLARDALALLSAHESAERFLAEAPRGLDRYRIIRSLGEGGFGAVQLAEQTAPIRRLVALKLLKPEVATPEVLGRFAAERQLLALMDHPGIARVYDAGAAGDGRPFVAMEFVDGAPITRFCDAERLPLAERLRLFERVCLAVQHAHQKGVIHRDLKPSNILVTRVDGRPEPKIIDFGIAKAIGREARAGAATTIGWRMIGTPEYMPPEQIGDGRDVDTRADVYALGVVLLELVAGVLPFDRARLRDAPLDELARIVRVEEPPAPATRFAGLDAERAAAVASARGLEPTRLQRLLAADLGWIIRRALEKDRDRRYPTAAALAADVRRHLDDEPVEAGPPSAAYRFSKFARRHRTSLAVGSGAAAAVLVGLVLAIVGLVEARAQGEEARAGRSEAEAVTSFLTDMLATAHPRGRGGDTTVAALVEEAARRLERPGGAPDASPAVVARLHETLGRTSIELGRLDEAERHLARAGALLPQLAPNHPLRLGIHSASAAAALAHGDRTSAARWLDAAESDARALGAEDTREALRLLGLRSDLAEAEGHLDEAEEAARALLERRAAILGLGDPDTVAARARVAALLMERDRVDEAEPILAAVLEARRALLGEHHPDTLAALRAHAEVALARRRPQEAADAWRNVLERSESILGPEHPDTLLARNTLATALVWLDRLDEAESILAANLESQRSILGPTHRQTLATLHNLAVVAGLRGREDEALSRRIELHRLRTESLGADHPDTILTGMSLGRSHLDAGRPEEALPLLERAMEHQRATSEIDGLRRIECAHLLATCQLALGREDAARPLIAERLEGKRRNAMRDDAAIPALRAYAEELLLCEIEDFRDPVEAVAMLERACAAAPQDPDLLEGLAIALAGCDRHAEAVAALDRAAALVDPASAIGRRLMERRTTWTGAATQER